MVDADEKNIGHRWDEFRSILLASGYLKGNLSRSFPESGVVIRQEDYPVVGVWIMPDNSSPGRIENFVSRLRLQNDVLWPLAEEVVERVIQEDCRFPRVHKSKARIHTWLAWQKKPGKPMGHAIRNHYVEHDAPLAMKFLEWFRDVFALPQP